MKEREHLGRWASPEAERRFRAMEDDLWREAFLDPPQSFDLPTCVGMTHAYAWPGSGTPFVFLHGAGGTALEWFDYVEARDGRAAYAVDTIGDVGRSVQDEPLRDAAHVAQWLDETLDALNIGRAHLVGSSYGGWLALNQAIRRRERVGSITLLDPAGIVTPDMARFLLWGGCVIAGSFMPSPLRRHIAHWTRMPLLEDKRIIRMVFYGQRKHPFRLPPAGPATDDELRTLATPTLALLGEKSELFRSVHVAERLRAYVKGADVEIIMGAGHALPVSHPALVCARVKPFAASVDAAA
jgi:pimeloyl-ACP methyl ester carboxylesterase